MNVLQENIKRGDTALAVKAGFWYVASSFLIKGLSFITTPIFSRLMSSTDYGEFANFASWQATLLIVTSSELYNTVGRAYYDHTDIFDQYVSSITIASFVITVFVYLLFIAFKNWLFKTVSIPEQYVHILFFTLMFQSGKQIYMARERTLYRYKSVALISIINLVVPTCIAVLLVAVAPTAQRLPARIYGFYLPSSVIGIICAFLLLKRGKSFRIENCKYAFKLSIPLLVHYLTAYLLTSSNTIIAKSVFGAQEAAIVSISSSTIHILTVLFQALSGATTTWVMDNLQQHNEKKIRHDALLYVGLLSVVAIGVIVMAPEIVWVLGGTQYLKSTPLIPGMVTAVLIQSVTSLLIVILTYDKNISITAIYTSIMAVLTILAKIFLLPLYGYYILPYINIVAFTFLFIVNYLLVKRTAYANAVNLKGIISILLLVCLVMVFSRFLYEHQIIRYAAVVTLCVSFLVVLYKKQDILSPLLKKLKE